MQVKTFHAKSTAQALLMVKETLGDDAVILSNRSVQQDGGKVCEIMAAVERPEHKAQAASAARAIGKVRAATNGNGAPLGRTKDDVLSEALDAGLPFVQEWCRIKDHFTALLKPQMRLDELAPRQRVALDYLEREGVEDEVVMDVYQELRRNPELSILPILDSLAATKPFGGGWGEKYHAFAGPHGAGKTSCCIRLALMEKRRDPKARICLVSADQSRGQGRLVLRHYADLSGLAFREVSTAEDFAQLKAESGLFDRILIDLPGLEREEVLDARLLRLGMLPGEDFAAHLVLPPFLSNAQYRSFENHYCAESVKSVIWTKLDEACTYGAMLNVAVRIGLPVSALSFGAGFRDGIAPAETEMMWRLLFKHQLPGQHNCKENA
jgi:flagellar biosynthesis protein FlhF